MLRIHPKPGRPCVKTERHPAFRKYGSSGCGNQRRLRPAFDTRPLRRRRRQAEPSCRRCKAHASRQSQACLQALKARQRQDPSCKSDLSNPAAPAITANLPGFLPLHRKDTKHAQVTLRINTYLYVPIRKASTPIISKKLVKLLIKPSFSSVFFQ